MHRAMHYKAVASGIQKKYRMSGETERPAGRYSLSVLWSRGLAPTGFPLLLICAVHFYHNLALGMAASDMFVCLPLV